MMRWSPLLNNASLEYLLQNRVKSPALFSNLIPNDPRLLEAIAVGSVDVWVSSCGFAIRRGCKRHKRFYISANSAKDAVSILSQVGNGETVPCVLSVIGRDNTIHQAADVMRAAGWAHYKRYNRMSLTERYGLQHPAVVLGQSDLEVTRLDPSAFVSVIRMIESSFDPLADQLPDPIDLQRALAEDYFLVLRCRGGEVAFLWAEVKPKTSYLKYVAVDATARGRGALKMLLRRYIMDMQGKLRLSLWVWDENVPAMRAYLAAGYRPDGLIDNIYVRNESGT